MPLDFGGGEPLPERNIRPALAPEVRYVPRKSICDNVLIGLAIVAFVGLLAALSHHVYDKYRKEAAIYAQVGQCFDTGAGAVGKVVYVTNADTVALAFKSGNIVRYPYAMLTKTACGASTAEVVQ